MNLRTLTCRSCSAPIEILEMPVPFVIPEVKRTWERVAAVLPPSDPADPADPSVHLDTLAAIATARCLAAETAERHLAEAMKGLREIADTKRHKQQPQDLRVGYEIARATLAAIEGEA